uniref:probable E3 ubiquitin ligase SUD1 n=1 Tax=Erigeron canadensis TaxID=72917 RepID=UPI001CB942DB|nr:probable E3 ubiquitin ligase SUD1 [Erigeron canadensis]
MFQLFLSLINNSSNKTYTNRNTNNNADNEDGDICRICRNPGDADNPLRYPCACRGSIKFVHEDCLLQWLNLRNARHCEVCKHPFSFCRVYADNAPARLPFWEIVIGMAMKFHQMVQLFMRLSSELSMWFLILPFITFWTWSFSFARSFGEAQTLFLSHISTTSIITDCARGFLLSISIEFITIAVKCLRLLEHRGLERERENEDDGNGAHDGRIQPAQVNQNLIGEGNGGDVGAQGIGRVAQIVRRNAEDAPFELLAGMQGHIFHLVEIAYKVLARDIMFLGFVAFVPFHLGRFILYNLPWILSSATSSMVPLVALHTQQALSLANIISRNASTALTNMTSEKSLEEVTNVIATRHDGSPNNVTRHVLVDFLKGGIGGETRLSDATTLAVGYMFIFAVVIICLGVVALVRYCRAEPLVIGRFCGIVSVVGSLFRLLLLAMIMLMIKFVFFTLMLGWWIDVCTLRMFGKSIAQRVEFFSVSPLASSLIHWVVGIAYLLQLVIFAMFLRRVLRHGVLYFLRDPDDRNMNPLTNVNLTDRYALNILLSNAFHVSIIVLLVFLPVKLAMWIAPSIFPLDISVSVSFTEIPNYILFFQILIPFAVEHFKMHATIKSLLLHWFTAVGWALGLTDYLLGRHEDSGQVIENDLGGRDRIHDQLGGEDRAVFGDVPSEYLNQEGANANSAEEADGGGHSDLERYAFVRGIVLLLMMAWMTLLIVISASIVVPLSIGRVLLNASVRFLPISHGTNCRDMYAFAIGSYVIWAALAGIRYCVDLIRTRRATVLQNKIWKWCAIVVKCSVLLLIWYFFIPVLIGLVFKLLVSLPMLVSVEESLVFVLYYDWAIGLGVLKLWIWLVMLGYTIPLINRSWQATFRFVMVVGLSRLPARMVLREIMAPIMMKLLTALCVPYVLTRGVFPLFGYSLAANSAVYRFAWLGCLGLSLLCFCAKRSHFLFTNLHNSIRDDRYLIGRGLHNFGEA